MRGEVNRVTNILIIIHLIPKEIIFKTIIVILPLLFIKENYLIYYEQNIYNKEATPTILRRI